MSTTPPNVNVVTLVGQLTTEPELRSLPDGRSVCDLRVAVNDQRDQPPLFIDVATFGGGAEACAAYLSRGSRSEASAGREPGPTVSLRTSEREGRRLPVRSERLAHATARYRASPSRSAASADVSVTNTCSGNNLGNKLRATRTHSDAQDPTNTRPSH
jgi:Single-strand binding protein family